MAVTKSDTWNTWAGSPADIHRALREASDAIAAWGGYAAVVSGTVTFNNNVSETLEGVDAVAGLHRGDLQEIRQLWLEVRPDRDAYYREKERLRDEWYEERRRGAAAGDEPPDPDALVPASADLRFSWGGYGLLIEVRGEDRHAVVGLFDRLQQILCRRQAWKRIDPMWVASLVVGSFWGGLALGLWLCHLLKLAPEDGKWEWQEVVSMIVGACVWASVGLAFWLLNPRVEVVDDGQETRSERFGRVFGGGVAAIVLGVVAAAVYDVVK